MKYAIYDKAAGGYLTKMEFEVGHSEHTQFECGYNELITKARLLDTKEDADSAIANIEGFKFMEKGRFVVHCFDDTLKEHYIISEVGEPTKVVDNITADLDGTRNVKYGSMVSHWSATSLEYAVNRLNRLQEALAPSKYTAWCNTFDIYKVIKAIDEKGFVDYQFIKVTEKGLAEYAKDEVDPLNKRIEELEKANRVLDDNVNYHNECRVALADMIRSIKYAIYSKDSDKRANYISYMTDRIKDDEIFNRPELKTAKTDIPRICKHLTALSKDSLNKCIEELELANYNLGETKTLVEGCANRLQEENNNLKNKVESIKKEAHNWKTLYENADKDREVLKNVIDNIYDDLGSTDIHKGLKETYDYVKSLSELNYIKIHNDDTDDEKPIYITAMSEFKYIINQMIVIMEGLELNQSVAFSSAEEVDRAKKLANAIINICEATDEKFEVTLNKFSQLYEGINYSSDNDDTIIHAFKSVLLIFEAVKRNLEKYADEIVTWKNKAQKAEKSLLDQIQNQKRLNKVNSNTIARMVVEKRAMNKELSDAADALKEVNDKNEGLSNMLNEISCHVVDIMYAIKERDRNIMIPKLEDILNKIGVKFSDDGPIYCISVILNAFIRIVKEETDWKRRSEEAIRDYIKCNEALGEWKRKYLDMRKNRDMALERAEKFKGIANSVYGMTIPSRCNGKHMFCDIATGKKILVDKKKYDDLMECVNNISLTYEIMKLTPFSMDRPSWLSGIINRINDLTK